MGSIELKDTRFFNDPYLRAYWRFEGNSTDNSPSASVTSTDANMSYTAAAGKFGSGSVLNGTSSKVVLANTAAIQPVVPFTIVAWIKTTDTGNYKEIFESYFQTTFVSGFEFRKTAGDTLELVIGRHTNLIVGDGYQETFSSSKINSGNYTHVAARWNGTQCQMFVNGLPDGTPQNWSNGVVYDADSRSRIGVNNYQSTTEIYFWNGNIDDLALFGRPLSDAEISSIYNTPPPTASVLSTSSGSVGAFVTLTGFNFGITTGSVNLTVASPVTASIVSWGDTSIIFAVPLVAGGTGSLSVTNYTQTSNTLPFQILSSTYANSVLLGSLSRQQSGQILNLKGSVQANALAAIPLANTAAFMANLQAGVLATGIPAGGFVFTDAVTLGTFVTDHHACSLIVPGNLTFGTLGDLQTDRGLNFEAALVFGAETDELLLPGTVKEADLVFGTFGLSTLTGGLLEEMSLELRTLVASNLVNIATYEHLTSFGTLADILDTAALLQTQALQIGAVAGTTRTPRLAIPVIMTASALADFLAVGTMLTGEFRRPIVLESLTQTHGSLPVGSVTKLTGGMPAILTIDGKAVHIIRIEN